jgi:hypothetical protein
MKLLSARSAALAVALPMLMLGCNAGPREGTYDQVFSEGSAVGRSGYKSTLVIEPGNRFRYQMPMMSVSGEYRRSGDSLYFETGSSDVRVVALRGRVVRDTLVLEQPHVGALGGIVGPDIAVQRFVRRR